MYGVKTEREPSKLIEAVSGAGCAKVLSNLKFFFETGSIAPQVPYPGA